jgi:hypothetical protein
MTNRAATAQARRRKPASEHVMLRRLATSVANKKLRVPVPMLVIYLVVLTTSAHADNIFFEPDTMSYDFVPGQSEFSLMGGIFHFDETYTIEGSFGLNVDFDANVASFVDVDAALMNPGGIRHDTSLDSLLNLTGASGTVVDATTLTFRSVDDIGNTVSVDVSLTPSSLTLVGGNTAECCDQFTYEIDAEAELVPDRSIAGDFNGDGVWDTADIDLLFATGDLAAGLPVPPADTVFDLNADGVLNTLDVNQWLSTAAAENGAEAPYLKGDANLDGIVDATDLNALALNWQGSENVWSGGDFTGDGVTNAADLNLLGVNWRQPMPSAAVAQSVPEPSNIVLLGAAMIFGFFIRRKY